MIFRRVFIPNISGKARFSLQTQKTRVRFAPSPTGFLHLGGLRTALYNYLFAKTRKGQFILRIEDTDQSRLVKGAVQQLERDLKWAGIEIDEGPSCEGPCGPYTQSQRLEIYKDHVRTLVNSGAAYHCFCTERRLELLRKEAIRTREVPKYDNRCRQLSAEEVAAKSAKGEQSCIRFKLTQGPETFLDLVFGPVTYDVSSSEGDPVIIKSDGFPTYHFANVVDDHLMEISHVLRGVEWQISTTKHRQIYKAFNWEPPEFAHLPLLLNSDGTKLSKRQGDIQISSYRESGIFPLALINFIVDSGGGFSKDLERFSKSKCYSIQELADQFDISRINSHSGRLMPEKLLEYNRLELQRKLSDENARPELVRELKEMAKRKFELESSDISDAHVVDILQWAAKRVTKLDELVNDQFKFIWISPHANFQVDDKQADVLRSFLKSFQEFSGDINDKANLNTFFKSFCQENGIKFAAFMKSLRAVLSGLKDGPSVAEMVVILGKDIAAKRIENIIKNHSK